MKRGISLAVLLFALFPMVLTQAQTRPATTAIVIKMTIAQITRDGSADATRLMSLVNQSSPATAPSTNQASEIRISIVSRETSDAFEILLQAGKAKVFARREVNAAVDRLSTISLDGEGNTFPPPGFVQRGTVMYSESGLLVDMIPHITSDRMIALDVAIEGHGAIRGSWQLNQPPMVGKRWASGRIAVSSGQTVIISGMNLEDKTSHAISDMLIFMTVSFDG